MIFRILVKRSRGRRGKFPRNHEVCPSLENTTSYARCYYWSERLTKLIFITAGFIHLCKGEQLTMKSPVVSCIVPVFNGERYLGEALDSILKQTYRPLEIIVADDGSTDGTASVAASYGDQVRYNRQKHAGAPVARNLGLSIAHGEFVAFLDSDDLWHPEKLQRQMARFEARAELDLCVTHLQNFWIPGLEDEEAKFQNHRLAAALPGYVTPTLLARGSVFHDVGLFNENLRVGDSADWFSRPSERGLVIEILRDIMLYRRMHESNMSMQAGTRRMTSAMQDAILRVVKASLDRRRLSR
jgi:glycosyltransferase involved in cell wall biosynthesis